MKLIHATDQYKIFEEVTTLEDSTDTANVLTIEFDGGKQITLSFSFGKLVNITDEAMSS